MTSLQALGFISLSVTSVLVSIFVVWLQVEDRTLSFQLLFVTLLSFGAFLATLKLIPIVSQLCLKSKLQGMDINKSGTAPM